MANNIITAAFSSSTITYTKPAYQYDYGMILKFSGIELPQAYEVHFSNTEFCGNSITQIGGVDGVTIPDEMFLNGNPIYAWTYLHTGADDGETVYKAVISINKRAKPSNKTPTPVQQDAITQAIAALNVAVEQTAADVVAAGESAEAAAGSVEAAGQAKDDAVEAKDKAVEAKNAAETAQGKSEDAQRAAEQAAGSVLGLTADASVDANVGVPSVEVNVSTVSDHKNMSFSFHNLKGVPGDPGEPGDDGFSPTVSVSEITGGHEVAVTDKNGTQTFDVMDGTDGQDGISPTITVTEITGGHEVEVVDAEGTQTFNVMDGLDGQSGLITDYVAEEKTPYLFRPSAKGLANVISEKDELIGGTVAWNQMLSDSMYVSRSVHSYSNGTVTFNGTQTGNIRVFENFSVISGHVYLFRVCNAPSDCTLNVTIDNASFASDNNHIRITKSTVTTTSAYNNIGINVGTGVTKEWDNAKMWFGVFDLTQMFGSAIADYLLSLGSTNAHATVKSWGYFLKDYYPYNSGDLQSVQTSAHKMTGFNQWDEEWEVGGFDYTNGQPSNIGSNRIRGKNYCKCLPSTQYYWLIPNQNLRILFYDADKNYINFDGWYDTARTITTPSNAYYFKLAGSAAYGTTYKNDICINLSGSRNGTYEPYSVHSYPLDSDLVLRGTLKLDAQNNLYYDGDVYKSDGTVTRNYQQRAYQSGDESLADAITDGTNTVVKLVTPTTEQADPYSEYQVVDADGTEEYVDERTVPIPVGHDTFYQQAVDIPQLPTTDGSYRLALSKTGNTATASWEYVAQAEMKAQTNIPSGKYFSVGERLFVSTQAIAQGANIVVGTNCTETTLADALNQINS